MIDQQRIDEISDAAKVLARHNRWRRGDDSITYPQSDDHGKSNDLGEAIDTLVAGVALLIKDNEYAWSRFDKMLDECQRVEKVLGSQLETERARRIHLENNFHDMVREAIGRMTSPITITVTKEQADSFIGTTLSRVVEDKANVELEPSAWEEHEAQKGVEWNAQHKDMPQPDSTGR